VIVRRATAADARAIADLHADSWRATYRGSFRDDFLDGPVFEERRRAWQERLTAVADFDAVLVLLGEAHDALQAFVCVVLDADPLWGALVDNLHVSPARKGRGYGRRLLAEAAAWVEQKRPGSRVHLWVHEHNVAARGFYDHLGGTAADRATHVGPEGSRVTAIRYVWNAPAMLIGDA